MDYLDLKKQVVLSTWGVSPNRRKFRHAKSEPTADTQMISFFWSWSALGRFSALQVSRQYDSRRPNPASKRFRKRTLSEGLCHRSQKTFAALTHSTSHNEAELDIGHFDHIRVMVRESHSRYTEHVTNVPVHRHRNVVNCILVRPGLKWQINC